MPKASGMITILDLKDAILSGTEPKNPVIGTLWIDSSVTPNTLKSWNGSSWVLQSLEIGALDPEFHQEVVDLQAFAAKAASDGYITSNEKLNVKLLLVQLTGDTLAGTTLPTLAAIDTAKGGEVYLARAEAVAAGIPTNHADYVSYETAYNSLSTYLNGLSPRPWVNGDTVVVQADWTAKWDAYYEKLSRLKVQTSTYLANAIKPGKDYNGVTLSTADGVVVLRGDNVIRTKLNATEGLSIEKNNNGVWTKVFGTNPDGKITGTGLVIDASSTIGGTAASTVVSNASAGKTAEGVANTLRDTTVPALTKRVTDAETSLSVIPGQIQAKVSQTEFNALEMGARNLVLKSDEVKTSSGYLVANYQLSQDWVVGQTYTITIKGTINSGQRFGLWRDTGYVSLGNLTYNAAKDLWYLTAVATETSQTVKNNVAIYSVNSTGAKTARIDWIKIEKGSRATDWTQAPEDIKFDLNALGNRATTTESTLTQTAKDISLRVTTNEFEKGLADTRQYVASRGENLVTNGTGYLGTNFNFSPYVFDTTESYAGNGSFRHTGGYYVRNTDEFIPINPENLYQLSYLHKSDRTTGNSYAGVMPYDRDGRQIAPQHTMFLTPNPTKLTQDLKEGDTVVHIENLSDFIDSTLTYQRTLIFWNFKSNGGFAYPPNTYSQNAYLNLWEKGSIDYVNNSITLTAPWPRATVPAGTLLSQGSSGGSYKYVTPSTKNTLDWVAEKGTIGGVDYSGKNANGFPPYTANVKIVFLTNSGPVENDVSTWINAVEFKDISMEKNAKTHADSALVTTKAEIKVTTDAINTSVGKLTTTVSGHTTSLTNQQTSINSLSSEIALKATKEEIISRVNKVRYIKLTSNGSTSNSSNHVVELEAFNLAGTNVALGKNVFLSSVSITNASMITDGNKDSYSYYSMSSGSQWIQLDLGAVHEDIEYLNVWMYYADGRTYRNTMVAVSADGVNWVSLHTGDLKTTNKGFIVQVNDNLSINRINSAEAAITVQSGQITQKVEKTDFTGEKTVSMINQLPEAIKIQAKNVDINGAVNFTSFDPATKTKFDQIEATANSANTKIDTLSIGGRNFYPNSGNFPNTTGWSGVSLATEDGFKVLKGTGTLTNTNDLPLEPGTNYVITAVVKFDADFPATSGSPNHIYVRYPGESSSSASDGNYVLLGGNRTVKANEWTTLSIAFKTRADTTKVPHLKFHVYTGTSSVKLLKSVKLEKGTIPTDWTSAPEDNEGLYTWVRYADSATGSGLSTSPTGKTYIGFAYNKNDAAGTNTASDYTWSLIKGEKGDTGLQGSQGIPGVAGADGKTSYTHIAYANSSNGATDFSNTVSTNRTYIGMYTDFTAADSGDPTKYKWTLIKGSDGAQGIPGTPGANGQTPYLHIAYATNATGSTGFSTTDPVGKTYMGTYTDFVAADSSTASKYKWTLIKGEKGDTGERGLTGLQGEQGERGIPGLTGQDGKTSYTHIAYATNATGSAGFSVSDPVGRPYIGMYTDFVETDSTDPTKYRWSLIKGEDGEKALSVMLLNENQSIIATSGRVASPAQTITIPFAAYLGSNRVAATATYSTLPTGVTLASNTAATASADGVLVFNVASSATLGGTTTAFDAGKIDITVTANGTAVTNVFNWSKAIAGTTARTFYVEPDISVLKRSETGVYTPSSLVFTSYYKDGSNSTKTAYARYWTVETTTDGTNWTRLASQTTTSTTYTVSSIPAGIIAIRATTYSSTALTSAVAHDTQSVMVVDDGSRGIPGAPGSDGRTPYLHIAYATNSNGTAGFSTTDSANKTFIGTYTDFTATDSTTASDYKWTLIKGETGATGPAGELNLVNNPSATETVTGWPSATYGTDTFADGRTTGVGKLTSSGSLMSAYSTFNIEAQKMYEVSVWLKQSVTKGYNYVGLYAYNSGGTNIGVYPISTSSGNKTATLSTNPYFWYDTLSAEVWKKVTGYVIPAGFDTSDPEMFKNLGEASTTIYQFPSDASKMQLRILNYSNTASTTLSFAHPMVKEVDISVLETNRAKNEAKRLAGYVDTWSYRGTTTIDGGNIETDTIKARSINAKGLVVSKTDGTKTFEIDANGEVMVNGNVHINSKSTYADGYDPSKPSGNRNFLQNSRFITGDLTGWTAWGAPTVRTVEAITDLPGFALAHKITTTASNQGSTQIIPTIIGNKYTVSTYVKAQSGLGTLQIYDGSVYQGGAQPAGLNVWRRISYTFTAKAATATIFIGKNAGGAVGTYWFTGVQVEEGDKMSPWIPSVEDTDNLLDKVVTTDGQIKAIDIATSMSVTPGAIALIAKDISLKGKVTFSDFASGWAMDETGAKISNADQPDYDPANVLYLDLDGNYRPLSDEQYFMNDLFTEEITLDSTGNNVLSRKTVINGNRIKTGTIQAMYADFRNVSVTNAEGESTFTIDSDGNLSTSGTSSSVNFVKGKSGWSIQRDGTAEFTDGVFRGDIQLGYYDAVKDEFITTGGLLSGTSASTAEKDLRFWAGTDSETAPFKVFSDGSLEATKGTFTGAFSGEVNVGNIRIADDSLIEDDATITISNAAGINKVVLGESIAQFKTLAEFGTVEGAFLTIDSDAQTLKMGAGDMGLHYGSNMLQLKNFSIKGGDALEFLSAGSSGEDFIFKNETGDTTVRVDGTFVARDDIEITDTLRMKKVSDVGNKGVDFVFI